MSANVIMFSGQGSQYCGMGVELTERYTEAKAVFDEASDILGFGLLEKCRDAEESELAKTVISQPAIMAVSLAAYEAAKAEGIGFAAAAGHSLGEYAALVMSGMVSRADGFRLIKYRSEAMQKAAENSDGAMYAVIGKDISRVDGICEETEGYVVPVNYNSLAQTVIAGERAAAEKAASKLAEMGFKTVKLNVASAFHSELMRPAADEFYEKIKDFTFKRPSVDVYSNLSGKILDEFDSIPERLAKHIVSPVRFTDELILMQSKGIDTYIEAGPGKVLSGLVKKTLKDVSIYNIQDIASLDKTIGALKGE